jgi:hypothetical protein
MLLSPELWSVVLVPSTAGREFGAKRAVAVAAFDSLLEIFLGGLAYRVLSLAF